MLDCLSFEHGNNDFSLGVPPSVSIGSLPGFLTGISLKVSHGNSCRGFYGVSPGCSWNLFEMFQEFLTEILQGILPVSHGISTRDYFYCFFFQDFSHSPCFSPKVPTGVSSRGFYVFIPKVSRRISPEVRSGFFFQ